MTGWRYCLPTTFSRCQCDPRDRGLPLPYVICVYAEDALFLDELAKVLQGLLRSGAVAQKDIERATGVDQTTISRAKSGKLRRVTGKLQRLHRYADMRSSDFKIPARVDHAVRQFLALGGSEAELLASIEHATSLVTRRLT